MTNGKDDLWKDATFMPEPAPTRSDQLLEMVYDKRQAGMIAIGLKLMMTDPSLCEETGFTQTFKSFTALTPEERREIVKNPVFVIWLKQTMKRHLKGLPLREKLSELKRIVSPPEKKCHSCSVAVDGKPIFLTRHDIDPLVAEMAVPEYNFPDERRRHEFENNVVYPEDLFRTMVTVALERIKRSWYEVYRDFPKFVNTVVDMIDGDYTSYSAADHVGVIFVSTDNSPLVALEEFLIHEFGHQILYHVMELDPIVTDDVRETYKLPWSGNERDFYGYFHAFYIYILMARYLERVNYRSKREQRRISLRIKHIIKGLRIALETFENTDGFTERGRHLFENLRAEVNRLEQNSKKVNRKNGKSVLVLQAQ